MLLNWTMSAKGVSAEFSMRVVAVSMTIDWTSGFSVSLIPL